MDKAGHSPYDIEHITGLPAVTTYRFLSGEIRSPSVPTVKKWAKVYGLTESQLRGDLPIEGMEIPKEKPELKDLLPLDEYRHVSLVKSMDKETRDMLYQIAEKLAASQPPCEVSLEKEKARAKLRIGEALHKKPPTKRRIKNHSEDGRHFYINGKEEHHKTA